MQAFLKTGKLGASEPKKPTAKKDPGTSNKAKCTPWVEK